MAIELRKLTKSFGSRVVLNGIDLKVPQGQILFVLGRSGTGKSVMLKNIVGLLRPDSGEIWVDGQEITRFKEAEYFSVRKKCGMVFQHPALFDSLNVFENVAFGLRRHEPDLPETEVHNRVKKCLSLVNLRLDEVAQKLPQEISYGMQKRVSLARTVAIEPQYLLFDEPTTGLDPVTTTAITKLIYNLSKTLKTTSIVVSHDMRCALETADHIVVLDKGQIAASETPDNLRKSKIPLVKDFLSEVLHEEKLR